MKYTALILAITAILFGTTGCATGKQALVESQLKGNWELNYISGKRIAFEGLYPDKKPQIAFDLGKSEIRGNSSCNGFSCNYTINKSTIRFGDPLGTMMACGGSGEEDFYRMLKKVNNYSVETATLTFLIDDVAVMRFVKK